MMMMMMSFCSLQVSITKMLIVYRKKLEKHPKCDVVKKGKKGLTSENCPR